MQVRESVEVFRTFAPGAWTPEVAGFLDVVYAYAVKCSGLGVYRPVPGGGDIPEEWDWRRLVRCKVSTITPEEEGVRVGFVVEGWRLVEWDV